MKSALHLIAEAILRLEHKIDILLRKLPQGPMHPQMQFSTMQCPVCKGTVTYQLDLEHQVAVRKCLCKSGLVPTQFDITPQQGENNALAPNDQAGQRRKQSRSKDRSGGKES